MAAEFVLTFAAEGILTKVSSLAAQELALASGFKAELEKLGESVSSIQDFLRGAAERPDDQGKAVEKWVKKLKQVAEDADDILDDFNYELLRRKVELHNHMKRKVLNFLSASNPLLFRLKMAHKIKKINNSLAVLKSQAAFINLVAKKGYSRQRRDRLQTDSFFEDGEKVVGREDAVTKIVTTLISSDNQQKNLSVMAIVGMAGLGKTTLAKSVYNEPAICTHFDKRIWVCVSNTFEVDTILSQLVDTVVPEKAGMKCQNAILEVLRKELTGNRYVLVLDDVWNKEKEKWDSLMSCLSKLNSNPGSCIIVTTRSTDVSTIAETLPRPELRNLSEEECWSIIKQRALNLDENGSIDAELERIGREIAEKCGGVPLVAKVLGSLLRSRASTVAEWSSILDNRLWELPEGEDRIMKVLKLSFDNLEPSPLKQCFAYCSMLRKDFEIERDNLIQLWMAQGLLQTSTVENHHEMEETGKEYFNILLNNSLIQEVIEGGTITKYTMHDLVHDLAEKVSESERLTQELNDDVRHVARSRPPSTLENMSEVTVGRLRSLFSNDQVPEIIFSKFKAMRVLSLDTAVMKELPNSFCKLKHLRYLDLSDTGITALPKSIGKLYNLQTLRMLRNWHLNKLPREMQNLINLRHLVLIDFCKCGELPILGHLPFLRDVEIRGMHNLKRFGSEIYGYDLVYEATREKETIVLFPALKTLSIRGCDELIEWMEAPTTTTTKVEVFPCLEKLKVEYCPSIGFIPIPHGMASLRELRVGSCDALSSIGQLDHCTSLQELKIYSCNALSSIGQLDHCTSLQELEINSCNALSSIGQLDHCTSLQELEIKWCNALSSIGQLDHCTSLQELWIDSCDALSSIGLTSSQGLPSLRELIIQRCDGLSALPSGIENCTSLELLCVFECNGLQSLPDFRSFTSLRDLQLGSFWEDLDSFPDFQVPSQQLVSLELYGWPKLKSLPQQVQHLTSLTRLDISSFKGVETLPEWLGNLASLMDLRISNCENLKYLPSLEAMQRLTKLQCLEVIGCPLLEERCTKDSGEEWPKISHIPCIEIDY
ncbi:PREDICTED: putative disease resistance protein RGA3 isoform X1 [Fragaria vesca subsp. vesca]|uniref:putative disease resistance protein RGA3 isoform X1 n=1 Tax=Fragaria vesca subsp. vesca TaxID=101020 RepID=UPI0002C36016|nr:PREDICTED: putative disease resistance protein RGA3 isoform X1 [Fragaria vesca subsp. vesca]